MKRKLEVAIEKITPQQAKSLLKGSEYNRARSDGRVDAIAEEIKAGEWRLNGATIVIDSKGRVIDGQHRLAACAKAGKAIESIVVRGVPYARISTIDTGRSRSAGDQLRIEGSSYAATRAAIGNIYPRIEEAYRKSNPRVIDRRAPLPRSAVLRVARETDEEVLGMARSSKVLAYRGVGSTAAPLAALWWIYTHTKSRDKFKPFIDTLMDPESFDIQPAAHIRSEAIKMYGKVSLRLRSIRPSAVVCTYFKAWNCYVTGADYVGSAYRTYKTLEEVL